MRGTRLSLSEYTQAVDAGWQDDDIGRAIIHDLPRRFHALSPDARQRVLLGLGDATSAPPGPGRAGRERLTRARTHYLRNGSVD